MVGLVELVVLVKLVGVSLLCPFIPDVVQKNLVPLVAKVVQKQSHEFHKKNLPH